MAEKKDKYLLWVEQGNLNKKLNATRILTKVNIKEADIARYLDISVKEFRDLKAKYPEFSKAADPKDVSDLVDMVNTLYEIGKGYYRTTVRREYYSNRKDQNKYKKSESDNYYPGNPVVLIYLLEKMYGSKWAKDYEKIQLAKEKMESKEEWTDGSTDDGNR